jgi:hypothetical protein
MPGLSWRLAIFFSGRFVAEFLLLWLLVAAVFAVVPVRAAAGLGGAAADGRVAVELGRGARPMGGGVRLAPLWDERGLGLRVELTGWSVSLPWCAGVLDAAADVHFSANGTVFSGVRVTARRGTTFSGGVALRTGDALLAADEVRFAPGGGLVVRGAALRLPGEARLALEVRVRPDGALRVAARGEAADVGALAALFAANAAGVLSGPCGLEAEVVLPLGAGGAAADAGTAGRITSGNESSPVAVGGKPGGNLSGILATKTTAGGDVPGRAGSVFTVESSWLRLVLRPRDVLLRSGGEAGAEGGRSPSDPVVRLSGRVAVQGVLASGFAVDGDVALAGVPVRLSGRLSPRGEEWVLRDGRLALGAAAASAEAPGASAARPATASAAAPAAGDGVGVLELSGAAGPSGWRARVAGSGVDVAGLAALAGVAGVDAASWNPVGACDVKLSASGPWPGSDAPGTSPSASALPASGEAEIAVRDLAFLSPGGERMLAKGAARLTARVDRSGELCARLDAGSGQLLLGTVYVDLAAAPCNATLDLHTYFTDSARTVSPVSVGAAASAAPQRAWDGVFGVALAGHARARASGGLRRSAAGLRADGWLEIADARLGALYKTFVRDPLALTSPLAAATDVRGDGAFSMAFAANATGASVAGTVFVRHGAVNCTAFGASGNDAPSADAMRAGPVELDLPFAYLLGDGPRDALPSAQPAWGRLTVGGGDTPAGPLDPLDAPMRLAPGLLEVGASLRVPVPGGVLELSGLRVDRPLSWNFACSANARLARLDLSRLGTAIPLSGELSGDLGRVRLTPELLSVERSVRGSFFGGRLTVSRLAVERPLEADRQIGGSVAVRSMDLEALSEALGVGRVTGRMDLDLDDFEAAFGQPVAFRLTARSNRNASGGREISLKAVNAISVMGTGSGLTGVGVGVFSSFFKQFAYRDIGFTCDLSNDVFRVRGLIREGGVEYLIRKPLLFGINVVNGNPDNVISFKDMLERIRRVVGPGSGPDVGDASGPGARGGPAAGPGA